MRIGPRRARPSENILILGLGGVGYYLARRLSHEGYAITAIESDPDKLRRADGEIDARLIRGDALSFDSWREAHAEDMDYVIAVTDNDAVNTLACLIADKMGVERKIARARRLEVWRPDALLSQQEAKIDLVIRPGELAAQEIARLLKLRSGNVVIPVGEGDIQVMSVRVDEGSVLEGATLRDLSQRYAEFHFRIVAISRGMQTIIPGGNAELHVNDTVFILAQADNMPALMKLAGIRGDHRHRVIIVGGGLIGSRVAELLEGTWPVTLVERDAVRAEELAHKLKKTTVLHGDGSETDTLLEAGLLDMDTVITATGDNETNIMTSVLARHLLCDRGGREPGTTKTVALVKREEYQVLARSIGADVVLNRKVLAGNRILKYVRRGRLLSVAHLHGCDAEVVEVVADGGSPITRKPLFEIKELTGRVLIGGVRHNGHWKIAVGSTHIKGGDTVVAIAGSDDLPELQKLFRA